MITRKREKEMSEINTITLNGVEYVRKDSIQNWINADTWKDMPYCIVRTYSAGVFAGYIEKKDGKEVVLRKVRRIWYWDGACSLSQLARDGTLKPEDCKFACEVDTILVTEAVEIISCTAEAQASIQGVAEWVMK